MFGGAQGSGLRGEKSFNIYTPTTTTTTTTTTTPTITSTRASISRRGRTWDISRVDLSDLDLPEGDLRKPDVGGPGKKMLAEVESTVYYFVNIFYFMNNLHSQKFAKVNN